MKVLFVSSGNNRDGISPIIKSQGTSLKKMGIVVDYYLITGKGKKSYFKHVFLLKKYLKNNSYNLVHAHYSLSAYVASLARAKPLIVSLMGSDVKTNWFTGAWVYVFYNLFWNRTIVKSANMQRDLRFTKIEIIPNGIDLSIFKPLDKDLCKKKLGWSKEIYHILFAANPLRHEKNFTLSEKAIKSIKSILPLELHFLQDLDQTEVPIYINASDMILLSSHWEGSPNVIKEAMACNCPAVSTDVGDVRWLFGDEPGYFITGFEPEEVTDKIKSALKFAKEKGKTKGRNRIIQLGLASEEIAKRIISIYSQVIRETRGK